MSSFCVSRGFINMKNQLDDLKLDVPNALVMFPELVKSAIDHNIILASDLE